MISSPAAGADAAPPVSRPAHDAGKWPALNPGITSSATYYDAWVSHPERLGIELLQDGLSAKFGALALNYAELRPTEDGQYSCSMTRSAARPLPSSRQLIINATGGWIDLDQSDPVFAGSAAGTADGRHQGLASDRRQCRRCCDALAGHMIYYENEDGRICILFPYLGKVLVGSTDIRVDDPDNGALRGRRAGLYPAIARLRAAGYQHRGRTRSFSVCRRAAAAGQRPTVLPAAFRAIISARSWSEGDATGAVHDRRQVDDVPLLRRTGGRHGAGTARQAPPRSDDRSADRRRAGISRQSRPPG